MMHEHPCELVFERLEAFHDGELSIDERVAIQNHLGECVSCNLASLDIAALSLGLKDLASQIAVRLDVLIERDLIGLVTPPPPALAIARLIDDDPVDPGAEGRLAAERRERPEDPQEYFL